MVDKWNLVIKISLIRQVQRIRKVQKVIAEALVVKRVVTLKTINTNTGDEGKCMESISPHEHPPFIHWALYWTILFFHAETIQDK